MMVRLIVIILRAIGQKRTFGTRIIQAIPTKMPRVQKEKTTRKV